MSDSIDKITKSLQFQNDVPLWGIIGSEIIFTIVSGDPVQPGPRGRWLQKIFQYLGTTFFGLQALRAIGMGVTISWWVKARNGRHRLNNEFIDGILHGHGAGSETELWNKFCCQNAGNNVHLSQIDHYLYGSIACPKILTLLKYVWNDAWKLVFGLRRSKNKYISSYLNEWMTTGSRNIGPYAFYKAWFEVLPCSTKRFIHLSPDVFAFSTLDSKRNNGDITIEFWQHGFLAKDIIFPNFHKCLMLTYPEASHIRSRISCCDIEVNIDKKAKLKRYSKRILFVSTHDWGKFKKSFNIDLYEKIFSWMNKNGFDVVIRPHPSNRNEDKLFWSEYFPEVRIDHSTENISSCTKIWAPLFLLIHGSTSLLDGLKWGILSICLFREMNSYCEYFTDRYVIPIEEIALLWKRDRELIEKLCMDAQLYDMELKKRLKMVFGEVPDKKNFRRGNYAKK